MLKQHFYFFLSWKKKKLISLAVNYVPVNRVNFRNICFVSNLQASLTFHQEQWCTQFLHSYCFLPAPPLFFFGVELQPNIKLPWEVNGGRVKSTKMVSGLLL